MNMLLALDTIPRLHNILASAFTWILLAGYVIFPGTFTSLQNSDVINDSKSKSEAESTGKEVLRHVAFLPLLWVAAVCCIIGASGMCWLWWRWSENYVWLLNRIFLPGCLNSLAGLVNTLVSVYTAQNRQWSITAKVTVCVTGSCTLVTGLLFVVYNNLVLSKVKRKHEREMQLNGTEDEHEDILHKINRKAREPALEPSSVV
ncbi:uncharacterized protein BDZ99DRAFT_485369 [Mytilinidion resinicola]|uniref:Uncharacterized protein n=1 Tax=Mytilinidion resinicola TaxID=574789 RepID=A0A6A6Z1B5_9PEZI|nr:uncharacterized protein BDZ99DRAFT_485369 [Mytilinidion resinicola]KAF2814790.1 hypothetical protein BDZ99DRAFT_485369 [Mytilinidion resinicola]